MVLEVDNLFGRGPLYRPDINVTDGIKNSQGQTYTIQGIKNCRYVKYCKRFLKNVCMGINSVFFAIVHLSQKFPPCNNYTMT